MIIKLAEIMLPVLPWLFRPFERDESRIWDHEITDYTI
jgi:hypothetical protein